MKTYFHIHVGNVEKSTAASLLDKDKVNRQSKGETDEISFYEGILQKIFAGYVRWELSGRATIHWEEIKGDHEHEQGNTTLVMRKNKRKGAD